MSGRVDAVMALADSQFKNAYRLLSGKYAEHEPKTPTYVACRLDESGPPFSTDADFTLRYLEPATHELARRAHEMDCRPDECVLTGEITFQEPLGRVFLLRLWPGGPSAWGYP